MELVVVEVVVVLGDCPELADALLTSEPPQPAMLIESAMKKMCGQGTFILSILRTWFGLVKFMQVASE